MSSANSQTVAVACPECGAKYGISAGMAGKRARCAKCGAEFRVPKPAADESNPRSEWPAYIGVECHTCGTLFYGGPEQVGQKLACPDCGARTVLPPPPPPKPKNIPAAMEGPQYELYEPETSASDLVAHQPKFIAVPCSRCETLIYATEKQLGETIRCPDCGRKNVVTRPATHKKARSPLASDTDTPLIDPSAAPGERPSSFSPEIRRKIEEEERESEYGRALAKSRRTGKKLDVDTRGRPILPRFPLFTGVLPFLFSPGVPVRIFACAIGLFSTISILLYGLELAMSGGFGAISGMCFFVIGCVLTLLCASMALSSFLTVVTESSEGVKQIQNWPSAFDWYGDVPLVVVSAMTSAFPIALIGRYALRDPAYEVPILVAGVILCFPVFLLSQLDNGSMWAIVSPRIVGSLLRCPFSWLTFYVLSTAIVAGCVAAGIYAPQIGLALLAVLAPLGTIGLFLYGRLLGRLGWRLAEAMPERS